MLGHLARAVDTAFLIYIVPIWVTIVPIWVTIVPIWVTIYSVTLDIMLFVRATI